MNQQAEQKDEVMKEAKRIDEDCLHSAKGHFETARFWTNLHLWIGIPTAILSAVAGASALSQFDKSSTVAGVIAILVAALVGLITFLNPNEKANCHRNAGNNYNSLKNRVRMFCNIDMSSGIDMDELNKNLKSFSAEGDELNLNSPQIPRFAYKKAKKGIEDGEADYKVDKKHPVGSTQK